ncbi:MAG: hypothetical protein LXA50_19880 [Betaproteobacteria bacterium]|nr:hypothetical protein [Betaproteobacteria bacterium]
MPPEPKLMFVPFFASAMNSATFFAGTAVFTTSTFGVMPIMPIAAKAFAVSNGSLGYSVALKVMPWWFIFRV